MILPEFWIYVQHEYKDLCQKAMSYWFRFNLQFMQVKFFYVSAVRANIYQKWMWKEKWE
jgi:hypothetical protein